MTTDEQAAVVETLHATIHEQKRAIDALMDALAARDHSTAALHGSVDAYRATIDRLQAALAERDATIEEQRALRQPVPEAPDVPSTGAAGDSGDVRTDGDVALTLANAAYDALLVLDANKHVIALNASAARLFGHEQPAGETLETVTNSPELSAMVDDALAYEEEEFEEQLVINKRTYRVRTQVNRRDGSFLIGLALQDVTELVRLNRARRDMVANISHELRTPIANIRLTIDSIFHEQEKPKGKESRNALKAIARETDSLLWLVQELLDLSMIESGQAIMRMVDVPADLLVNEAVERLEDQSNAKGIAIKTEIPETVWVLADRDQARRVLINLIHNAIKWSPANSTIRVRVHQREDDVVFAVLDDGPGVPDELKDRIFERFYQADAARSGESGSGLGLAICKHIVEAHGGKIWAEGNGGEPGGRFLFTLPNADERLG